ncbi:MAG: hydroxyacid dehydrogenase [Eubacteriales bacterium]
MKILLPLDISSPGKDYLTKLGYELIIGSGIDQETVAREIEPCVGLLLRTSPINAYVLERAPNLKVIGRHGVGVDNIDLECATKLGIAVTNSPLANYESVAEHAVAMIFACSRRVVEMDHFSRSGQWAERMNPQIEDVAGKTIGIVGLGRIGLATAQKCALGLSMKVVGYRAKEGVELPDYITPVDSLEELLQCSDYVSLHIPSGEKNRYLLEKKHFEMMKEGAILINTARGDLYHEEDLYHALNSGRLRSVGVDVLAQEPPSVDNPLFSLKNLIISPHCAALSQGAADRMGLDAALGIHQVLTGVSPTWPVNQI